MLPAALSWIQLAASAHERPHLEEQGTIGRALQGSLGSSGALSLASGNCSFIFIRSEVLLTIYSAGGAGEGRRENVHAFNDNLSFTCVIPLVPANESYVQILDVLYNLCIY